MILTLEKTLFCFGFLLTKSYLCKQKNLNMEKVKMLGALVGDIVGSVYEFDNTKSMDFELFTPYSKFTDDSVMTLAVAKWLTEDETHSIHYLIYCMQELGSADIGL